MQLLQNEAYVEELPDLETAEAVQKAQAEKGIDLALGEIAAWAEDICAASKTGELDKDDMENVACGTDPSSALAKRSIPLSRPCLAGPSGKTE